MKFTKLTFAVAVAMAALALGAGACGDDDDSSSGTVLKATLKDTSISLDRTSVPAGEVTITAKNEGQNEHEFILLKTDLGPGALVTKDGKVDEKQFTSPGEIEAIQVKTSKTGSFTLEPGHYVFICNLLAHYEEGMHTELTVR